MKPPIFDYIRADSADEAVSLLAEFGEDARILAGGQSLMPALNMRFAQPRALIGISSIAGLGYVRRAKGHLAIGAATTQASLERRPELAEEVPLLARAIPHIGHVQTRNRGTVCGSIAHADPSAELPLCLVATGGEVVLHSQRGRRTVTADNFFTGMLLTERAPDELVEEVRFPLAGAQARYAFTEVAMRHGDFALVALAATVDSKHIALAVGGVADRPMLARWPRDVALEDALAEFAWSLDAQDDNHASAKYRRHVVRTLGSKLITGLA